MSKEKKSGRCATCLRRGTAACKDCRVIISPGGESSEPSAYLGDGVTLCNGLLAEDLTAVLAARIARGMPLPLAFVEEYNKNALKGEGHE